jgi:hypothetical protein
MTLLLDFEYRYCLTGGCFERNDLREVFGGIKVNEIRESDIIRNYCSCLEI